MLEENFCPGCGENRLRKPIIEELGYEEPCTKFHDLKRETIEDLLRRDGKSEEVIKAVLEFYFPPDVDPGSTGRGDDGR